MLNKANFQKIAHLRKNNERCIHTKNILAVVDLAKNDDLHFKFTKHLNQCDICQKALDDFKLSMISMQVFIPKPQIDLETKTIFEIEIHELFKTMGLNSELESKKKLKSKVKKIDQTVAVFIQNLFSSKMLVTYLASGLLFLILKHYFN